MKKVLFATTALIATAGMAAAEVRLSGYARFGLDYNEANKNVVGTSDTNITSRFRLTIDASTETDSGVTVGARLRAQSRDRDGGDARRQATFNNPQFYVAYGGLRVNAGQLWGAVDSVRGLYINSLSVGTGIDGMDFNSVAIKGAGWDSFTSAAIGPVGVEAIYSAGGFTGHISHSQRNGGTVAGTAGGESRTAVALSYSFNDFFVSGAYQSSSDGPTITKNGATVEANDDVVFVAAGADFGQFGATVSYGQTERADSVTLAGEAEIGASSNLIAWVNSADVDAGVAAADQTVTDGTSFGINYEYDLGGGVTFVAGYVNSAADDDDQQVQAGLHFSF